MTRTVWNARRKVLAGGYSRNPKIATKEPYQNPPLPEFYCKLCDLEFRTGEWLAHHRELRHEER